MTAVDLSKDSLQILPDGSVKVDDGSDGKPKDLGGGVIVVGSPKVRSVGSVKMSESSRHRGERHLDGDELVYLVAGSAGVELQRDESDERELIKLRPGEIAIVPRHVWHRIVIEKPSEFLFLVPGRTEVRVPQR
jgi:quercetin dioxygenase-like cupin family protein